MMKTKLILKFAQKDFSLYWLELNEFTLLINQKVNQLFVCNASVLDISKMKAFYYYLGDLAASIRNRTSIRFGLYHSMFEWFNPLYLMDKNNKYETQYFVKVWNYNMTM